MSVIIPTHNRAGLIGETLESVFAQDYRPVEIIVVDDGSTDDTEDVVRSFEPRARDGLSLRYVRQEKAGAPAARNRGMRESSGEYVQFLDSDDLIGRSKLGLQVEALAGRKGPWAAYGPWRCLYDDGKRRRYGPLQQTAPAPSEDWMLRGYLSGTWFCPLHSYLFNRAAVDAVGAWDEELERCQDSDYLLRNLIGPCRFTYAGRVSAAYRRHNRAHIGSAERFGANLNSGFVIIQKTHDLLMRGNMGEAYRHEVANWIALLADNAETGGHAESVAACRELMISLGLPMERWEARHRLSRRLDRLLRAHIVGPLRGMVGEFRLSRLSALWRRATRLGSHRMARRGQDRSAGAASRVGNGMDPVDANDTRVLGWEGKARPSADSIQQGAPERESDLVSIIIPCYNCDRYVGEAIRSALGQTYPYKEVIVVDDGSTDGSLEVIRAFGTAVNCVTQSNKGGGAARNRGLRIAKGKYVKFHDADDVLCPDAVNRQVAQSRELSPDGRGVVFGDMGVMNERGDWGRVCRYPPLAEGVDSLDYLLPNNITTPSPLHRTQFLTDVGGFDVSLPHGQEGDLHLRLCLAGVDFVHHPGTVFYMRQHDGIDRISSRPWYQPDARYRLSETEYRASLIRKARGGLSDPVRRAFAAYLEHWGRDLMRAARVGAGEEYLAAAMAMSPDGLLPGGKVYRALRGILGSRFAELLCVWRSQWLRRALRRPRMLLVGRRIRHNF